MRFRIPRRRTAIGIAGLACALLLPTAALGAHLTSTARGGGISGGGVAPTNFTVYTETNARSGNQIAILQRTAAGGLHLLGAVNSGGRGSGILTDTSGALSMSQDGRWLVAVNVGSNSVSAFAVAPNGLLRLTGTAPSGGTAPNSVTIHGDLVYTLNPPSRRISGLRLRPDGSLVPLPGSTRYAGGGLGAQISFNPAGDTLVVTNRQNSAISTFQVDAAGYAHGPASTRAPIPGPYGFAFTSTGTLILSDAALTFPTPGGSAVSGGAAAVSYALQSGGKLQHLSTVKNGHTLACWVAVSRDDRYAWTSNFGDESPKIGSISSFRIGTGGTLSLIKSTAAPLSQRRAPHGEELAVSSDNQYLYIERVDADPPNTTLAAINTYHILPNGGLQFRGTVSGLPGSDTGVVAR